MHILNVSINWSIVLLTMESHIRMGEMTLEWRDSHFFPDEGEAYAAREGWADENDGERVKQIPRNQATVGRAEENQGIITNWQGGIVARQRSHWRKEQRSAGKIGQRKQRKRRGTWYATLSNNFSSITGP